MFNLNCTEHIFINAGIPMFSAIAYETHVVLLLTYVFSCSLTCLFLSSGQRRLSACLSMFKLINSLNQNR